MEKVAAGMENALGESSQYYSDYRLIARASHI